ncbi:MAG: cytochrome d ubiquinol oxidase subunit II [Acidimicrobiales bacterium]
MSGPVASLNTAWFALIGVLWTGYFVLEGFDFGVGILSPLLAADDVDRRITLNTIGPFWDGNEVWLLVAGGATFAAFPTWYATMFSGFYLALFLILVALILRGVAFEYRAKRDRLAWRRTWGAAHVVGSLVPALLWGVAFTDLVRGLDIVRGPHYVGGFAGLVHPIALVGGLASLLVFSLHGAVFLSLKTTGDLRRRARRAAAALAVPALVSVVGVGAWLGVSIAGSSRPGAVPGDVPAALVVVSLLALGAVGPLIVRGREGIAFAATAGAIVALSAAVFTALFPRVMVSSVAARDSLTVWNTASAHETLLVMTVVAAIFTPFVLAYQAWTYWVFRQRLTRPPAAPGGVAPTGTGGSPVAGPGGEAPAVPDPATR